MVLSYFGPRNLAIHRSFHSALAWALGRSYTNRRGGQAHGQARGAPKYRLDFRVGTKLPPRSGGPAAGARSALRRAAPEARARVSKRRISSLSFCTLLHFPSLTPLEFSPIRLKMTSFGEHDQQKVHISHSGAKHALIDRARGRQLRHFAWTSRIGTCMFTPSAPYSQRYRHANGPTDTRVAAP